ncbi:PREDICTED: LON peptidase N-terminal domain and RING finger protein 3-like [Lupinus angustifolius]|uniref:LON peptidase N-terminal domain and RING finger protein 3-like n=1 Tax=Lupinus angustifolius TaxID=3871 RepID=UPI00092E98F7|nr:PREDICTED: LON peptidase N-terminal domain and RING finger protein 3-like [Lupinus angustifolius]
MVNEEQKRCSPKTQKNPLTESNVQNSNTLFSPRFKNAAALAGWDEEALLLASLVVEDTPDRDSRTKKRFVLNSKSPHTNSRRKRRVQRSPHSIPVAVLNLDEEDTPKKESGKKKKEKKTTTNEGSKIEGSELKENVSNVSSSNSALPCIDKLRDELSCAICLEICFEPSTTPCGHSFCRKCLRSAADKCGKKCPKCRQLISNGRSCTVNTVLWNTIQLLFPQEVEARKAASASKVRHTSTTSNIPEAAFYSNLRNQSTERASGASSRGMSTRRNNVIIEDEDAAASVRRFRREIDGQSRGSRVVHVHNNSRNGTSSSVRTRTRRGITTSQDEDAALAQRLQREEFMQAFRGTSQEQQTSGASSLSLARANVRAMVLRMRDRRT